MFPIDQKLFNQNDLHAQLILIAEDDPAQRLILKTVLEKEGYRILEANNGLEAISQYKKYNPQMVLLDAVMPELDGFEACRQIRALEGGRDVLILMITALTDDESVRHSFEVGAADFISKPICWSALTGRVKHLLQIKIVERYLKQTEDKYLHTQKLEVVGNLTEGISHHFNNLLVTIVGYTEMLLNGYAKDDEAKQTRYLQEVHTASLKASELIAQMQFFSDGGENESKPLMLNELLEDVMGILRTTLPSSIELHMQQEENLPEVKTDAGLFHQIMMNMVINARDAMESSGDLYIALKRVDISNAECASCHQSFQGDYVELMIRDTGVGIAEDKIKRIFEPYYTTQPIGQGSGMGLSVVHGIMHNHSGHIQVDTVPGQQTTFKLYFPVAGTELSATDEVNDKSEHHSEVITNARILLVDDEEAVGNFEVEFFKANGYQVTYFVNPDDAIVAITKTPEAYDLVITDKIMPHIDGLELASAITAIRPDLPIILCTGNKNLLSDVNLERVGIRALITKPARGSDLLSAVERVLKNHQIKK